MMFGAILLVWGTMTLAGMALLGEASERELYWRTKCKEARALADVRLKRIKSLLAKKKGKKPGNAYEKRLYAIGKGRKS